MRKFRGKRKDNGKWVYGSFVQVVGKCYIVLAGATPLHRSPIPYIRLVEVIPESVRQFVGKLDKNKKEICQGHIVKWAYDELVGSGSRIIHHKGEGEVFWSKELLHFGIREEGIIGHQEFWEDATYEIIGTVHDKEK